MAQARLASACMGEAGRAVRQVSPVISTRRRFSSTTRRGWRIVSAALAAADPSNSEWSRRADGTAHDEPR